MTDDIPTYCLHCSCAPLALDNHNFRTTTPGAQESTTRCKPTPEKKKQNKTTKKKTQWKMGPKTVNLHSQAS